MTPPTRRLLSSLLVGLSLVAVACSGSGSGSGSSASPAPSGPASPDPSASAGGGGMVDATGDWRLVSGTDAGAALPLVPGSDITLTMIGSQVSGRAACNQYGGAVVVHDGQVRFGPLMLTEMGCAAPIMASEAAYTAALAKVTGATRDGDTLTLTGEGVQLAYARIAPVPAAAIVETDWLLDSLIAGDAVSSVVGQPATLRLGSDGSVTGSTGCRSFSGRYAIAGAEVTTTDITLGKEACPADLTAQDTQVTAVLDGAFRAVVEGQRLTLTGRDGSGLGYHTRTPEVPLAP